MKKLIYLSFKFFFFFLLGCGNAIVYNADGSIENAVTGKKITKKISIDDRINHILMEYQNNNDIQSLIKNFDIDVIYNDKLYFLKDKSLLYKTVKGYNIGCLAIKYSQNELFIFLLRESNNKIKFLTYETPNGCTPLKFVIVKNNYDLFKLIINNVRDIDKRYLGYAMKFKRYLMVYDLLNKIYKNNIPISAYIKYAKNTKFKQKTINKYFNNQLLKKINNSISLDEIINKLSPILTYDEKINFYVLVYNKKNILPQNNKLKEIVLLKTHPKFAQSYNNLEKLKNYVENFDFSQKDASLIYKLAKTRLLNLEFENVYASNDIDKMEDFIKNYSNYSKNNLLRRRIAELNFYKEFELYSKICNKNSFKWNGNFKDNYPYGKGCFYCESNLKSGFFWSFWQKSLICFDDVNNQGGYIKTELILNKFLSGPKVIKKNVTTFKHQYDVAGMLVENINSNIRTYKSRKSLANVDCDKIRDNCLKNCKYKNSQNGFFIFSQSDKSKCEKYCYIAHSSCKDGNIKEMKEYICDAKCVGYKTNNGGIFTSSDYEKCVNRCMNGY